MNEKNASFGLKSEEFWLEIVNEGVEDRVQVNERMLIEKMLSRYSSDFVVYRELIQNSDDAQSTCFTIQLRCDPSTSIFNYQSINQNNSSNRQRKKRTKLFQGLGQLLTNSLGLNSNSDFTSIDQSNNDLDIDWNNCLINEIRTENNGNIFNEDDWKRVITIAEGNTNVDAIGQFGVGFFSVFSYSEKVIIQSGNDCLAFAWKNRQSLTTFRKKLSLGEEESLKTLIILPLKKKYLLLTKFDQTNEENRSHKAKENIETNEIVPTLNLIELKTYLTKVLSFTKFLKSLRIEINGSTVFHVQKTIKSLQRNQSFLLENQLNKRNKKYDFLHFNSFEQTKQKFEIENGPSIELFHINVKASVTIDQQFAEEIEKVIKKSLPSRIEIQFLFPSNKTLEFEEKERLTNKYLKELIPLKFDEDKLVPIGQIFIGLATHQSTGIGIHISTHLIPTIERENIDLQDPYISIWNEQIFNSIGKILRLIYQRNILHLINHIDEQSDQSLNTFYSLYAFEKSSPNEDIGRLITDGFISSDNDLLVPVRRCPSDNHLSLIPSTEAFLSKSKSIERFLDLPLVPFEISEMKFFQILKRYQLIEEINSEIISNQIHQTILCFDQLIELLRWLCTHDVNDQCYIKEILSKIRYREDRHNVIIQLNEMKYYNHLNLNSIPLPDNVLPSNVVVYFSNEDLEKRLFLSLISIRSLIKSYLLPKEHSLLLNENTSKIVLHFICKHLKELNESEVNEMKEIFSKLECIPTTNGMKLPNQSYIPSIHFPSHLSIIKLSINGNEDEYPVSIEFLRLIACRTIYIPRLSKDLNNEEDLSSFQSNEHLIKDLLEKRKNLSENDLDALKNNPCLLGRSFRSDQLKCKPCELHFPSVGQSLEWNELLILDWPNLDRRSEEYSFLKELGVREVPNLVKLLLRIDEEYENGEKSESRFQLPKSLCFFAQNFEEHYSKIWKSSKIDIAFLPSLFPQSSEVILSKTELVFQDLNPFFASIQSDVLRCFSLYFDISLIGVQKRPTIVVAFEYLMKNRNELLNVQSAREYFAYFNELDGINQRFIENVSKIEFLPLPGKNNYVKPSEVFLVSKSTEKNEENSIDQIAARGLIDYVDYGVEANSFLSTIGVLFYPTAESLANLLIDRQENYFRRNKDENEEMIEAKLRFYINCLKQLSVVSNFSEQLNNEPLKSRLRNKRWCLAYRLISQSREKVFEIGKPSDVYLDDDHQSALDIKPLCAPDESELMKFYHKFGSKWLSENVQRTFVHTGKSFSSERTKKLFDLINYRLDMLFVNNRGEILTHLDEKRFQLLKNHFSVYEADGIQCRIDFEKQRIILNSNECTSAALEFNNKQVSLFIRKDLQTLDYIDISTELTRFVFRKTIDTLIYSITDKLSSPLETLKRRGIPVDRLLKVQEEEQPNNFRLEILQTNFKERTFPIEEKEKKMKENNQGQEEKDYQMKQSEGNGESIGGFFQNLRDLFIPIQSKSFPIHSNSSEHLTSEIERDRVKNFAVDQKNDDNDINEMVRKTRPYSQREFLQSETYRHEKNNSCEFVPSANLVRYENLLHGIPLYIDRNVLLTNSMIDQGKQLAHVLSSLAEQVFHLSIQTIHLFRDIDSARIAFNTNGSLFYNLRYFEQVFADQLKISLLNGCSSSSSSSIIRKICNFYYIVTCHELSHNVDSTHDLNFLNRLERVSVTFMDAKDAFLYKFSFQ